jgi:hypothetical protein
MKKLLLVTLMVAGIARADAGAPGSLTGPIKSKPAKTAATGTVPMAGPGVQIKMAEDGDQLWCHIRFQGIESGQTVKYRFRWTAPAVVFLTKKGEKIALFSNSVYPVAEQAALVAGDNGGTCYCKDSGEKGCWRSKAYRTLKTDVNEKWVRAVGTWKVEVLNDADGTVLGSLTYDVK